MVTAVKSREAVVCEEGNEKGNLRLPSGRREERSRPGEQNVKKGLEVFKGSVNTERGGKSLSRLPDFRMFLDSEKRLCIWHPYSGELSYVKCVPFKVNSQSKNCLYP